MVQTKKNVILSVCPHNKTKTAETTGCVKIKRSSTTRKPQFLINVWIFLHQILLVCSTPNCPLVCCFMLYLLDVSRLKSRGNLTAEDYKFAHLTCILWRHYLEKCKSHFSTMLFICFRMFRLLLNKMDYKCDCHNAAVREVTSYRKCSKWRPSARTQLRSLLRHLTWIFRRTYE